MTQHNSEHIIVLGAGNFGTCLAQLLAEKGYRVSIWSKSKVVVDTINQDQRNPRYLSSFRLSDHITAINKLDNKTVKSASVIVVAIPTQSMRSVLQEISSAITVDKLIICAAKGLEISTLALPGTIISECCSTEIGKNATFLSGPSFAEEVIIKQPTAVSIAGAVNERAEWAQTVFHCPHFRVYSSFDPVGVQVGGALKNVMAIASGVVSGIGLLNNAKAALITRGLAEMVRIGVAMGANPLTFNGLSGVGDLFLTCNSEKSRNFTVGFRLGKGKSLNQVVKDLGSVAEGVTTTKAALLLSQKLNVSAPITEQVYKVLYENKPIDQAVTDLMTRDAKQEIEF